MLGMGAVRQARRAGIIFIFCNLAKMLSSVSVRVPSGLFRVRVCVKLTARTQDDVPHAIQTLGVTARRGP